MTAFDRFETRLPELLTELAESTTPDYVTDLLRQAAHTRQRPAWSAFERWLPMGAIARTFQPVRFLPWRGIAIAGLLLLLAVAALALYLGSSHALPAPFGPARNGLLFTSAANGDIVSLDPATGTTRPVITGGGAAVAFNSTGQSFYFDKSTTDAPEMWVANADGSGSHHVWSGPVETTWIDWSQDGTRLVIAEHPTAATTTVHLVDVRTSVDTKVTFDKRFTSVAQAFGSQALILEEEAEGQPTVFYLANADGSNLRVLPAVDPVNFPNLSPDGTRIAYSSWADGYAKQGRLHVLDLATGADTALATDANVLLSPVFSPDGTQLAAQEFVAGTTGYVIAVLTIDASKGVIVLGSGHSADNGLGVSFAFSPDGTKLIARYADDSSAWLYDATGATDQPLPGITTEFFSWQRAGE